MKNRIFISLFLLLVPAASFSCSAIEKTSFSADFNTGDRVWIGREFWAVPTEDWQVRKGRLECRGERENMRVNLLTSILNDKHESFSTSVRLGLLEEGETRGYAGFSVGIWDEVDDGVKALCYFGQGVSAGITTDKSIFIEQKAEPLPEDFDLSEVNLTLKALPESGGYTLNLVAVDKMGRTGEVSLGGITRLQGLVALFNRFRAEEEKKSNPGFW